MIVKIWPVKADYAGDKKKVGGSKGLKNSLDYIKDPEKVAVEHNDVRQIDMLNIEDVLASDAIDYAKFNEKDTYRVLKYMANDDKIEGRYISGFMCDPDLALQEFQNSRDILLNRAGIIRDKETGALAFHIVQSFPEELEISNEEVHQCGIELCKKIGLHQAVICSHVHPTISEFDGEIKGKSKHNHILINAYIHPKKWDPKQPGKLKYNDCRETYALLRIWNDEIAIDHGLPIIRNPDNEKLYSWKETEEINKGLSWKERIRVDIEDTRRSVDSWAEFKEKMESQGYKIRDDVKHISFTAPDGVHVARGKTLGREYTKESLELFWSLRKYCYQSIEESVALNDSPPLSSFVEKASEPLTVAIPLGTKGHGENNAYYYLPLVNVKHPSESVLTYFNPKERYDICDEKNRPVTSASGQEIIECIEQLRNVDWSNRKKVQEILDQERLQQQQREQAEQKQYYTYALFINSRTKRPYRTSLVDKYGRRRTALELIFLLAITVLKKEPPIWEIKDVPQTEEDLVLSAPRNWKIQNMLDAISDAREAGVETPGQLDIRLQESGAAYSRARSALFKTKHAKENMEMIFQTMEKYLKMKDLAEKILNMPEGPEKEALKETYGDVLDEYRTTKAVMYRYNLTNEENIQDFKDRYKQIGKDISELEDRFEATKEDYRQLKKIQYAARLAQNAQYCYGPAYDPGRFTTQEKHPDLEEDRIRDKTQEK